MGFGIDETSKGLLSDWGEIKKNSPLLTSVFEKLFGMFGSSPI
jgi:hypothetical protein